MYTQCPDCSTVFRVTAEALRAAQGRVRCGICSSGFDALENLSESPVARAVGEPEQDDTITVEELPGTEFIELSGAAQPGEDGPDDLPAGADALEEDVQEEGALEQDALEEDARHEEEPATAEAPAEQEPDEAAVGDVEPAADPLDGLPETALEFHGSVEDLEKLFIPAAARDAGMGTLEADLPEAIEEVASRDLSGIEVTEQDLSWPDDGGTAFDPANPAHVAAVLASSSGEAGRGAETDLDRTDEYPVLVIEDYEEANPQDSGAEAESRGPAETSPQDAPAEAGTGDGDEETAAEADAVQDTGTAATAAAPGESSARAAGDEGETSPGPDAEDGSEPRDEAPLLIIPEELRHGPSATAADDLAAPLDLD